MSCSGFVHTQFKTTLGHSNNNLLLKSRKVLGNDIVMLGVEPCCRLVDGSMSNGQLVTLRNKKLSCS